jgi:nitrogenase-associated protein
MAKVVLYEKPGCASNARQKALLVASGHELDVRDLTREPWSAACLRPFFGDMPLRDWFNRASPRIKSGEVRPDELDEVSALAMMVEDPLLIRRPLMQVGGRRMAGFEAAVVDAWIGLAVTRGAISDACLKPSQRSGSA